MKKTISVRILAAAAAVTLLFAACRTGDSPSSRGGEANLPNTTGEAGFKKYDPPIDITMIKGIYPGTTDKFAALGESVEENRWIDLFREELGINIKYLWVATIGDSYDTKVKLMFSSGTYPDLLGAGLGDMTQLAEADMIWDMTQVYKDNASELTNNIIMADGGLAYKACQLDGKLMAVPQVTSAYDTLRYMYIRTDWLEKLNLEPPKSMDDLHKIMEAFVKQDPDGNGKNDTYATYIDKGLWTQLEGYFWGFDAYPSAWLEKDGQLIYGSIQPEIKDALRSVQNMYKDGWLDPEFFIKPFQQAKEIVTKGKTGVVFGYHWMPLDVIGPQHQLEPDSDWGCFPIPSKRENDPAKVCMQLGLNSALVVNKQCAYPEAAVEMMNLYFEKQFGETADYGYWADDEEHNVQGVGQLGPLYAFHPLANLNPYRDVMKVHRGEMKVEDLKGASLHYYKENERDWEARAMWGTGDHTAGTVLDFLDKNQHYIVRNAFVGAPTPTIVERGSTLEEIRATTFTRIMSGELDVDTAFDQFVSEWKRLGGDKMTAEVNEWYQSNK